MGNEDVNDNEYVDTRKGYVVFAMFGRVALVLRTNGVEIVNIEMLICVM